MIDNLVDLDQLNVIGHHQHGDPESRAACRHTPDSVKRSKFARSARARSLSPMRTTPCGAAWKVRVRADRDHRPDVGAVTGHVGHDVGQHRKLAATCKWVTGSTGDGTWTAGG
ncbi:MAG: hypothetical protein R2873_18410 [Caldilineaceae bacterium]